MPYRTPKRSTPPSSRPTKIGVAVQSDDEPEVEPFLSSRPTRRDVSPVPGIERRERKTTGAPRGQFSIPAASGVPADAVSGTIEIGRKRRRTTKPPLGDVQFVSATKRSVTIVIEGRTVTLDRHAAIALASMIFTAFE